MSFTRYPKSPSAPLLVPGLGDPAGNRRTGDFDRTVGSSEQPTIYNEMMFLRVAMFGAAATPAFDIAPVGVTGVAVPDEATGVNSVFDAGGEYIGDVWLNREPDNVVLIIVGFLPDAARPLPSKWTLGITNADASAREFTWVVATNRSETAQPWIDVTPQTRSYAALAGDVFADSFSVSNKGTTAFHIDALSPALPPEFSVGALPTVSPSSSAALTVTFTAPTVPPLPDGSLNVTAALTISPSDDDAGATAGHNNRFNITAITQQLEVVMLLDDSGSMSWDPLGNPTPTAPATSRWLELSSAANQFLNQLAHFGEGHGKFGIARFPASNPSNPATYDIVAPIPIPDMAGITAAQNAVAAIVPTGGTPMGDGIDRVIAIATSYFGTDAVSVAANRRWLILMSDGAHNSGTHNPQEFIAPPSAALAARRIELFAVAYGIPGHTNVDHALLTNLKNASLNGGQIRAVDQDGVTANVLAQALRDTIKSGLSGTASPRDPEAVLRGNQGQARHEVLLTPYDRRIAITLNWTTPDPDLLRLELLTPGCELINPENAGTGPLQEVTFRSGTRFNMYLIGPDFLRNDGDPAAARYGTWTLLITRSHRQPDRLMPDEYYAYDVAVESSLRMNAQLDRGAYYTGDPIGVSVRLTADGVPVTGAHVVVSTKEPTQSADNWLANLVVPADALQRAARQLDGKDSTPILVKTLGAQLAGLRFPGAQRSDDLVMTDPDETGDYQATFVNTGQPEHHSFYITAVGVTPDGIEFRREAKLATYVLVRPHREFTSLGIDYRAPGSALVTVVPRDRFGNVLLVDPITAGHFRLVSVDAEFDGSLTSHLDGSYSQPLTFRRGATPSVGVTFAGKPVLDPAPVPLVGDLIYVDHVLDYRSGPIVRANRHANPEAVLGGVADKPPDRFVSLGASGQLTVGIRGCIINATESGGDVAVFVVPDTDRRSYRVEASVAGDPTWRVLGESIGITQSFSLRAAGIDAATAVRIDDTSGRARGPGQAPLESPGVGLRGVGVKEVSRATRRPPWIDRLIRQAGKRISTWRRRER
jgi:hypothetical protein